jgi:hypothetical protein
MHILFLIAFIIFISYYFREQDDHLTKEDLEDILYPEGKTIEENYFIKQSEKRNNDNKNQ